MEHMQARHRLKQHHRARLGHLGLGFCDDNAARLQQLELLYADARGIWEAESTLYETVTASACHASTTDNEVQTIGNLIMSRTLNLSRACCAGMQRLGLQLDPWDMLCLLAAGTATR